MSLGRPPGSLRFRQAVDVVTYAIATVATVFAIGVATAGVYAVAVGHPVWSAVKYFLFVAGFALVAYATLRLWPARPADDEANIDRPLGESEAGRGDGTDDEGDDTGPSFVGWLLPGGAAGGEPNPGTSDRERGRSRGREETRFQRLVLDRPEGLNHDLHL